MVSRFFVLLLAIATVAAEVCAPPDLRFATVLAKFERFHRDPVDVALHVLTTPIIFLGYISLATKVAGRLPVLCVAAVYVAALPFCMDQAASGVLPAALGIWAVEVAAASRWSRLGWLPLVAMAAFGAFGQFFAHWVTGERGYMEEYIGECRQGVVVRASSLFAEQAFFQLPLVLSVSQPPWWGLAAAVPVLALVLVGPARGTDPAEKRA